MPQIPDGLHLQCTELDSIEEIQVDRPAPAALPLNVVSQTNKLPSNFPAQLDNDEVKQCWAQARKEMVLVGADKHAVQRRALELISQFSEEKFKLQQEQEKLQTKAATMPKKVRRRRVARDTEAATNPRPKVKTKSKSRTVNKHQDKKPGKAKAAAIVLEDDVFEEESELYEVTLSLGENVVATLAEVVVDTPQFVVVIIEDPANDQLLQLRGVRPAEVCVLAADGGDEETFVSRRVLASPYRYMYNGAKHIVFSVLPDGM